MTVWFRFLKEEIAPQILIIVTFIILFAYIKLKQKKQTTIHKCFVALNDSMYNYRRLVIGSDIHYYAAIVFLDTDTYFVDMKMKFFINHSNFDLKYLFLDFYNCPSFSEAYINNKWFKPSFVHGRIYLDKKLLKIDCTNHIEIAFRSKVPGVLLNPLDHTFMLNSNLKQLPLFLPIFDQNNFRTYFTWNFKSFGPRHWISSKEANLVQHKQDMSIYCYAPDNVSDNNFFIQSSYKPFNFRYKKLNINSIKISTDHNINNKKILTYLETKIETAIETFIKHLKHFFKKTFGHDITVPNFLNINFTRVSSSIVSPFYSKSSIIIPVSDFTDLGDFKFWLFKCLCFCIIDYNTLRNDIINNLFSKNDDEIFAALSKNKLFISVFKGCNLLDSKENLFINYIQPSIGNYDKIDTDGLFTKKFDSNAKVYEYFNYLEEPFIKILYTDMFYLERPFDQDYGYSASFINNRITFNLFKRNCKKNPSLLFDEINYHRAYYKRMSMQSFMNATFQDDIEMFCFLEYWLFKRIRDDEIASFFIILSRNTHVLYNVYNIKLLSSIFHAHFLKQFWFFELSYKRLLDIIKTKGLFEDKTIRMVIVSLVENIVFWKKFRQKKHFKAFFESKYGHYDSFKIKYMMQFFKDK